MTGDDRIVLGGDIGGTNSNFCLAKPNGMKKPDILIKSRLRTNSAPEFSTLVNRFLESARKEGYEPRAACFAIAGPVRSEDGYQTVKMTNAAHLVDTRELIDKTPLDKLLLLNDFEAISYAINIVPEGDLMALQNGKEMKHGTKAVLGAGTGLGKNILHYHDEKGAYIPLPSEGGHADMPISDREELELARYVKGYHKKTHHVCYEDLISGRGLEAIYSYLQGTKYKDSKKSLKAVDISLSKNDNECSRETFDKFINVYARCARNFALDTLCTGGLYIAGGIAAKNSDSFGSFIEEFCKHDVYAHILREIPVHLITNYDISLLGAPYALKVQGII